MSGSAKPRHIATPIAQVLYPAKSQKICPANAAVPAHALTNVYPPAASPASAAALSDSAADPGVP